MERQNTHCDVLILGAGPAGLSAAIYAARAKLITAVIDEGLPGGQTASTYHVANYPGTNGVIRGIDLIENMKKQALDFGAFIDDMKEIHEINLLGEEKHIRTEDTDYYARSVIIATGAQPRKLPAEGEKEYRGRGVHYCATCDGALYQDADIMVVGGGNSAVDEAIFLTRFAKKVTLVHIHESLNASKASQDELFKNSAINVMWNHNITQINGDTFVKSVMAEDLKTGEKKEIATDGIFVYIGMEPKTAPFKDMLNLNDQGYIIADEDMKTNIPGVFAAGDVRNKKIRQISTAVGDGTIAGIMAEKFVNGK
ncbi:MAG TPA: thioredoxin-disulfide reductase [Clostridia bacterium]